MTELFLNAVNRSISASWLVLAVLLLRILLKKTPKWVNVLLWGMVAFRLLCPVAIESPTSLVPSTETIRPEIMMDWGPEIDTGIPVLDAAVNPIITESFAPHPAASANPLQILIPVAANVWAAGILGLLVYTAISYLLLRRKVATAVILRYNIFQSEYVTTPFVLGILKPRIYLPFSMSKQDIIYVVSHEKAHIRRCDHWWKPLGFLLLTLYWFNPVLWLAYRLFCRDIELACDEAVIRNMNSSQRADYAQALLSCSANRPMAAVCPIAFGEVGVKARIRSVMRYQKPAFWLVIAAVILCLVVAACFLTDPKPEAIPLETTAGTEAALPYEEQTAPAAAEAENSADMQVRDLAYYMELAVPDREFQDMNPETQAQMLEEYGGLLADYALIARESRDDSLSFIVGCYTGETGKNPFADLSNYFTDDETGQLQVLYPADGRDAVEEAIAANTAPEQGYLLRRSCIDYSPVTGHILIRPVDSSWGFHTVFSKYLTANGRAYMLDAASRGIALYPPEGPYLDVSLISEKWGEISEKIPLTQEQVNQILSQPRLELPHGHGFMARLELGPDSAINIEEDAQWFTESQGVPQLVTDLAVEQCDYQFASPEDITSSISQARLECSWLEAPVYALDADLPRLEAMLKNAEFGYVGACGYGAKLVIQLTDGSEMMLFKGTDGCDTLVFGSFGGYFLGDPENTEFWNLFGLDAETKEPLN